MNAPLDRDFTPPWFGCETIRVGGVNKDKGPRGTHGQSSSTALGLLNGALQRATGPETTPHCPNSTTHAISHTHLTHRRQPQLQFSGRRPQVKQWKGRDFVISQVVSRRQPYACPCSGDLHIDGGETRGSLNLRPKLRYHHLHAFYVPSLPTCSHPTADCSLGPQGSNLNARGSARDLGCNMGFLPRRKRCRGFPLDPDCLLLQIPE
jgi:hypothetical protein